MNKLETLLIGIDTVCGVCEIHTCDKQFEIINANLLTHTLNENRATKQTFNSACT